MTEQAISSLRRRMIEDMTICKFAQKTQHDYWRNDNSKPHNLVAQNARGPSAPQLT
jgi:hypothetical protein